MLSVAEAVERVLERARPLAPRRVELLEAHGCRLAEPIVADRDSPPFDKSLVDGFAVRSGDLTASAGPVELRVIEEVTAGRVPCHPLEPGQATAIMTGAPLPQGADAVVMREFCERNGEHVRVLNGLPVQAGSNRMPRGREMRAGQQVLDEGRIVRAIDLGLLAAVGAARPLVMPRPRISILATGDEVVPWTESPGPAQIRNSNTAHLFGLARNAGGEAVDLGIARDDREGLREAVRRALDETGLDVLLLSGGVSVGQRDLVPAVLGELGVEPVFHRVRLKPGKPLFFGVREGQSWETGRGRVLVFGLPGNPVSTIVGFLLFVRPAIDVLSGRATGTGQTIPLRLSESFTHRGDRQTYHPCVLDARGEAVEPRLRPLAWAGSPDLLTITRADGFARFGPGDRSYEVGEVVEFLPIDPLLRTGLEPGPHLRG